MSEFLLTIYVVIICLCIRTNLLVSRFTFSIDLATFPLGMICYEFEVHTLESPSLGCVGRIAYILLADHAPFETLISTQCSPFICIPQSLI